MAENKQDIIRLRDMAKRLGLRDDAAHWQEVLEELEDSEKQGYGND